MVQVICLRSHQTYDVAVPLDAADGAALVRAVAAALGCGEDTFTLLNTLGQAVKAGDALDADRPYMVQVGDGTAPAVREAEGGKEGAFLNMKVDITPDVDLLVHSGDDYDLVTACAELVDNSIQNTAGQADRQVNIVFKRHSAAAPPESLTIFDNGCGMTIDGLKQWAVLGRSTHRHPRASPYETPRRDRDLSPVTPVHRPGSITTKHHDSDWSFRCERRVSDYLSSDFSRYGVGSKRAIFSLGDTVVVTSKTALSPWVGELVLSRDTMREEGWRTTLTARHPTSAEAGHPSFTSFAIHNLRPSFHEGYTSDYMATCMAHMYHYYLWGPRGNARPEEDGAAGKKGATPSPVDTTHDPEKEFATERGRQYVPVDLKVDGKSVRRARGDPESLLLQTGAERITFDFQLGAHEVKTCEQTPISLMRAAPTRTGLMAGMTQAGDAPSSQPPAQKPTEPEAPVAKVVLYYFPFRDGAETMPIPAGLAGLGDDIHDERVPLCDRKSGLEVFWNGRLLPREFIDAWPLLRAAAERKDSDVPAACFRRVKGMVFLDSAFEVTANKHSLVRETALAKALAQYQNRVLIQNVRKWVRHCHRAHDEELIFGEVDKMEMKGDGSVYYKSVKVTNMMLKKGCHVLAKQQTGRGKVIGRIATIFTDHRTSEAAHGCLVKLKVGFSATAAEGADMVLPVGLVQRVLSAEEAAAEVKKGKKNAPTKLVLTDFPETMQARDDLRSLNIKLMIANEEGKAISRVPATLDIAITAVPARGACVGQSDTFTSQHKYARAASFNIAVKELRDAAIPDLFRFAGRYTFVFRCSIPTVAPLEHTVQVTGAYASLGGLEVCDLATAPLDVTVDKAMPPMTLLLRDVYGNAVPYASVPDWVKERCTWTVTFAALPARGKPTQEVGKGKEEAPRPFADIDAADLDVKSSPTGVVLKGCVARGAIPPLSSEWVVEGCNAAAKVAAQLEADDIAACSAPTFPPVTVALEMSPAAQGEHPFAARARNADVKGDAGPLRLRCAVPVAQVHPGAMHALVLKDRPEAVGWRSYFRAEFLVTDKYGNPSRPPPTAKGELMCGLALEGCAAFMDPAAVKGAPLTGASVYRFDRVGLARPADQPMPTEGVFVTLKATCYWQMKGNRTKATQLTTSLDVEVKPPSSYPFLALEKVPPAGAGVAPPACTPLATVITAEVGAPLQGLEAVFMNPPRWVTTAKVKCPWGDAAAAPLTFDAPTAADGFHRLTLPPLQAPQKPTRVTHVLTAYCEGCETDTVEHKVTVVYVLGAPCSWKVTNHPEQVKVREVFTVQCRAVDKFGNDIPCSDARLKGARLGVTVLKGGGEATAWVDDDLWETKHRDTTWSLSKLKLGGKAAELTLCVTSTGTPKPEPEDATSRSDDAGKAVGPPAMKSRPFKLTVLPGDAAATTIDGERRSEDAPLVVAVENFACIAAMRVGLVDEGGNSCQLVNSGGRQSKVMLNYTGDVKLTKAASATQKERKNIFDSRAGIFTPTMMACARPFASPDAPPATGRTYVSIDTAGKKVAQGCVEITVRPGKLPWHAAVRVAPADAGQTPLAIEVLPEAVGKGDQNEAPPAKRAKREKTPPAEDKEAAAGENAAPPARMVRCGEAVGEMVEVAVQCEDGTPCLDLPSDRLAVVLTSAALPSNLIFNGPVPSSQQPQALVPTDGKKKRKAAAAAPARAPGVRFHELAAFTPVIAGVYSGKLELDLMYHPARDHLEKIKCIKRRIPAFTFTVAAAAPSLLKAKVTRPAADVDKKKGKKGKPKAAASTWGTSHHLGGVAPEKPLFDALELRVEDQYGNLCNDVSFTLSVVVRGYTDNAGAVAAPLAPSIDGGAEVTITDGTAQVPQLRLTPNLHEVPEGLYCISFEMPGGTPALNEVAMLPFQYTDDAVKQKQAQALADRKAEWVKIQHHIKQKLQKYKQARAAHQDAEAKWDARLHDLREDMLRTRKLKHPNWETFNASDLWKQTKDVLQRMDQDGMRKQHAEPCKKQFFQDRSEALRRVADGRNAAGSGVVGIAGEIGFVKDEQVDMVIAKSLGRMMQLVILDNTAASKKWKAALANIPQNQSVPMLALDMMKSVDLDEEGRVASLPNPNPRPKGWVGYATNLIELEDKNIYLRPAFHSMLGNKAIFDTIDNAREYRKTLLARRAHAPVMLSLDGDKLESSGIEWGGKPAPDLGYRFGQMPYYTTEKYRGLKRLNELLETYLELLEERDGERAQREPVDPDGKEPQLVAELGDITARIQAITKLLDGGQGGMTLPALQAQLEAPLPEMSQRIADLPDPEGCGPRPGAAAASKRRRAPVRSPTPPESDDDDEDDVFRFAVSQKHAGKKRRV